MKTRIGIFLPTLLALLGQATEVQAVPSAFTSTCGAITIDNTSPSTLLRDSEDCKLIWVLPPNSGVAKVTQFTPSANLGMCTQVKKTQNLSSQLMDRMNQTSLEIERMQPNLERAYSSVAEAKKKVYDLSMKQEIKQMREIEDRIAQMETRIDVLVEKIAACDENCDDLRKEHRDLRDERRVLTDDLRKLRSDNIASVRLYERAKANLESAESEVESVTAILDKIQERQARYQSSLQDMLLYYSRLEGGFAHMDYNTGWDDAVRTLTDRYGSQYQFQKVPTKDARIFANIVGAANENTYLSSMPAILDYSIAGLKFQPFGEERTAELSALPGHLGGSIRLSLMGACPLYYANFLTSPDLRPAGEIPQDYGFAISASYKYASAFKMKMTASYNLYKFYEKIAESSSSGGLFSRRQSNTITENRLDRDTFHIDWNVEDPDSLYTEEKRHEIASAIKTELIGRVLGEMAQPAFTKMPDISASVPMPSETGAIVLAKGLQETCGYVSTWCTAGAWVLRGLDAIFGSSSASSTYRSTHDRTATETWSSLSSKWSTGATVFTAIK
jgi:hypothetical protein